MTRTTFLGSFAAVLARAQVMPMGEVSEGFVSLYNGRDLGQWEGDETAWTVGRGALLGNSDGKTESVLRFGGREFGDFELRFDLRVDHGAGIVQMHGRGAGPIGVAVQAGPKVVQWLTNGHEFTVISNIKLGEWNSFRIICKNREFDLLHNDTLSTIISFHGDDRGTLSLRMPAGFSSAIQFRNLRFKE